MYWLFACVIGMLFSSEMHTEYINMLQNCNVENPNDKFNTFDDHNMLQKGLDMISIFGLAQAAISVSLCVANRVGGAWLLI